MPQHLISETTRDGWENEGGSPPSSDLKFASISRILTELYVVDRKPCGRRCAGTSAACECQAVTPRTVKLQPTSQC